MNKNIFWLSRALFTLLLMINQFTLFGQGKIEADANEYFEAYHKADINVMSKFLSDSAVLIDETATILGSELKLIGKDIILQTLDAMFSSVKNVQWESEFKFSSGDYSICAGTISYSTFIEESEKKITYQVISIIEFNSNANIIKHTDYADYEKVIAQMSNDK